MLTSHSGKTILQLWWPRPTKDLQTEPKKRPGADVVRPGVGNLWPMGQIRPAKEYYPACDLSNPLKSRPRFDIFIHFIQLTEIGLKPLQNKTKIFFSVGFHQ